MLDKVSDRYFNLAEAIKSELVYLLSDDIAIKLEEIRFEEGIDSDLFNEFLEDYEINLNVEIKRK